MDLLTIINRAPSIAMRLCDFGLGIISIPIKRNAKKGKILKGKHHFFVKNTPPRQFYKEFSIVEKSFEQHSVFFVSPKNPTHNKVIFFLHGGAYVLGMTLNHWLFIKKLAKETGCTIVVPDYPLAPKHQYKVTTSHVLATYKELLQTSKPEDIIVMGDSAGGGLGVALSILLNEKKLPQPSQLLLLSPWLDVSMTNPDAKLLESKDCMLSVSYLEQAGEMYAGKENTKDPIVSPVYIDSSVNYLPPTIIFHGTHDILFPDSLLFFNQVKKENPRTLFRQYQKMPHDWMLFPVKEKADFISDLKQIIKS